MSQLSQVCRIVLCRKRQSCRLVTIEKLITILTIDNLNSWQSLLPDNQEWKWTAFAIIAMFFWRRPLLAKFYERLPTQNMQWMYVDLKQDYSPTLAGWNWCSPYLLHSWPKSVVILLSDYDIFNISKPLHVTQNQSSAILTTQEMLHDIIQGDFFNWFRPKSSMYQIT